MKIKNKISLAILASVFLLTLSACGGGFKKDIAVYMQGMLDSTYRGVHSNDYLEIIGETEEDAIEDYETGIYQEALYVNYFFDMQMATDAQVERTEELLKKIYSYAKYKVGKVTELSNGNYSVEIFIDPIDIMLQVTIEDLDQMFAEVTADVDMDSLDNLPKKEYDALEARVNAEYNDLVLDFLESKIPNIGHTEQQSITVQMVQDEDDLYYLEDQGFSEIDALIINYTGEFSPS